MLSVSAGVFSATAATLWPGEGVRGVAFTMEGPTLLGRAAGAACSDFGAGSASTATATSAAFGAGDSAVADVAGSATVAACAGAITGARGTGG